MKILTTCKKCGTVRFSALTECPYCVFVKERAFPVGFLQVTNLRKMTKVHRLHHLWDYMHQTPDGKNKLLLVARCRTIIKEVIVFPPDHFQDNKCSYCFNLPSSSLKKTEVKMAKSEMSRVPQLPTFQELQRFLS